MSRPVLKSGRSRRASALPGAVRHPPPNLPRSKREAVCPITTPYAHHRQAFRLARRGLGDKGRLLVSPSFLKVGEKVFTDAKGYTEEGKRTIGFFLISMVEIP